MRYIGLDVPYSTSMYCVRDAHGQELQCETVRGHWPKLLERLRTVTKALDEIGERHAAVLVLRTIPGVGIRTAETVAAHMDHAKRFVRSSQVGAYFGLVPCQDASAGVNHLGHITRQGPAPARKYLVEAAWQGVYRSPTIGAYFERIQHGRPERR